jgi:hypothetical protein
MTLNQPSKDHLYAKRDGNLPPSWSYPLILSGTPRRERPVTAAESAGRPLQRLAITPQVIAWVTGDARVGNRRVWVGDRDIRRVASGQG